MRKQQRKRSVKFFKKIDFIFLFSCFVYFSIIHVLDFVGCFQQRLGNSSRPLTAPPRPGNSMTRALSDLFRSNRACLGRATLHSHFSRFLLFSAPHGDKITVFISSYFQRSGRSEVERTERPVALALRRRGLRYHRNKPQFRRFLDRAFLQV